VYKLLINESEMKKFAFKFYCKLFCCCDAELCIYNIYMLLMQSRDVISPDFFSRYEKSFSQDSARILDHVMMMSHPAE